MSQKEKMTIDERRKYSGLMQPRYKEAGRLSIAAAEWWVETRLFRQGGATGYNSAASKPLPMGWS